MHLKSNNTEEDKENRTNKSYRGLAMVAYILLRNKSVGSFIIANQVTSLHRKFHSTLRTKVQAK